MNTAVKEFTQTNGDLLYIEAIFKKTKNFDGTLGMYLKTDFKKSYTAVLVKSPNKVIVKREYEGIDFMEELKPLETDFDFENEDTVQIQVLVDRSSVEAFFFGGLDSMTNLALSNETCSGMVIFIDDINNTYVEKLSITVLQKTVPLSSETEVE